MNLIYKRKIFTLRVLFTIAISTLCFSNSFSQWQQVSGLYGEPVYCVRASSTKLFSLTLAGGLVSTNNGGSWSVVPELYLTNVIERMSASGSTIVAFASPENYISSDNGVTWSELNPPSASVFASDLFVDNGAIYMSTYGDYIYKSTDNGLNWTQTTTGLTTPEINCVWAEGNDVYVGTDDGVFKSSNGGASFSFSGLAGEYVTRIYTKGSLVFAYSFSGIFRSGDDGLIWGPFEPAFTYSEVTDFLVVGNKVFATTSFDLITSNAQVAAWVPVSFSQNISFNNSICEKGSSIFIGNNRGVYESTDAGITWDDRNIGIIPVNVISLGLLNNDTLFAGSSIYGVSRYASNAWEFSGLGLLNANDLVSNGNDIYSASEFGINKSSDGGNTWTIANNTPVNPVIAYCADIAVSDSLMFGAALQLGILRSGDFGASWSTQNTGIAPSLSSSVAVSGQNMIVGTYDNGLFTSTDGGFNFTQTGAIGEQINDITVIGNKIIAASAGANGNYVSNDQGLTWNPVFSDYFDCLSTSGPFVFASSPGYLQVSLDSGMTYVNFTAPPTGAAIASSTASATDVYIGTYYHGVWKRSISEINGIPNVNDESLLVQIHPSLFHTEAILYVDEKLTHSDSELQITDLSGKLVYSVKITQSKTTITNGNLAEGVYIYKVINEKYKTKAGKIVIN